MWVGVDQPATIGQEGYGARYALPIWSDFIKAAARKRGAREFLPADGMQEVQLCKVSYLKPVEGCPTYTEYFKEGDDIPSRLCPIHQGTVKQQIQRAVKGFFSGLGQEAEGDLQVGRLERLAKGRADERGPARPTSAVSRTSMDCAGAIVDVAIGVSVAPPGAACRRAGPSTTHARHVAFLPRRER